MHLFSTLAIGAVFLGISSAQSIETSCSATLKNTPPANAYCGATGKVSNPKRGKLLSGIGSATDCAAQCAELKAVQCASFAYTASTGACQFYKQALRTMNFVKKSTTDGITYYDRSCYSTSCYKYCTSDAEPEPQNPDGNLFESSSFEGKNAPSAWQASNGYFYTSCKIDRYPYDGTGYTQLSSGATLSQPITTAGSSIDVQLYYRIANNNGGGDLSFLVLIDGGSIFNSYGVGNSTMGSYQLFEFTQNVGSAGNHSFELATGGNGQYLISVDKLVAFDS